MYTVIQWKTAASDLQFVSWANRTVEAKLRTIQKTMTPVLHGKVRQCVENDHDISAFRVSQFFSRRCSER